MPLTLHKDHQNTVVGFGRSSKPLGKRSESELLTLFKLSKRNKNLLQYFSDVPSKEEIERMENKSAEQNPRISEKLKTNEETK